MPRNVAEALAWAKKQATNPTENWHRQCLGFVRQAYGFGTTGTDDAGQAWDKSKKRHKGDKNPPAGALVYWETKSVADHVALSAGGGKVYSNDICEAGKICLASIEEITRKWGCEYQGWAADYCGKWDLPLTGSSPPAPAPKPGGFEPFPGDAFFKGDPNSPVITAMGKRLVAVGCGKYKEGPGPRWSDVDRASYKAWQQKLGYSGDDADGWPGKTSWDKLQVPNV